MHNNIPSVDFLFLLFCFFVTVCQINTFLPKVFGNQFITGTSLIFVIVSTIASILYEKKVDPFPRVKSWLFNGNSTRTCSDRFLLTELTRLGEPMCLFGEKLARLEGWPYHRKRRVTLLAKPTFLSHVNRSLDFVRKCRWLSQGSSGRRVTFLQLFSI